MEAKRRPKRGQEGQKVFKNHRGNGNLSNSKCCAHTAALRDGRIMRGAAHGKTVVKRRKSSPGASRMTFPGVWRPFQRPRSAQDRPKSLPESLQERFWDAQECPRNPPERPRERKRVPWRLQKGPRASKRGQKSSQDRILKRKRRFCENHRFP